MAKLVIFRQRRRDGAERWGVEVDGDAILQHFTGDADSIDPVLSWYIDIRGIGSGLPVDPEALRDWLCEREEFFASALRDAAEELAVGFDSEIWPFQYQVEPIDGLEMKVVCSAARRIDGLEMSQHLDQLAEQWTTFLGQMSVRSTAA